MQRARVQPCHAVRPRCRPVVGFLHCAALLHSLLEFVQVVALNVAINSHSHALLTLMVSNNFIELKVCGCVCVCAAAAR